MATVKLTIDKEELTKILKERIEIEYQRKVVEVCINTETVYIDRFENTDVKFKNVEIVLGDKIEQKYGPNDR